MLLFSRLAPSTGQGSTIDLVMGGFAIGPHGLVCHPSIQALNILNRILTGGPAVKRPCELNTASG